jgi:predicted DsbA family dithiol-disulfide isomerase
VKVPSPRDYSDLRVADQVPDPTKNWSALFSNAATAIMVICCVLVTTVVLRRDAGGSGKRGGFPLEKQKDWQTYVDGGRRIGPIGAKVVLVEFSDFQCPACRSLEDQLRTMRKKYPQDVAIVYRHFPLQKHALAYPAAVASECAASQGRFEEMHHLLFDKRDSVASLGWNELAKASGVSRLTDFAKCMRDSAKIESIQRDMDAATRLKVMATPTVLINGVRFAGSPPAGILDSLIRNALGKTDASARVVNNRE